ncbi:hypothetical protein [Minwuia sp.]|uniref:hypothetical protein n=1 Tax=Minwuia sp. TaxID=2493630 RepID=UPI003A93EA80
MTGKPEGEGLDATIEGLRRAFADRFGMLETEVVRLRQQMERQSRMIADQSARELMQRRLIEEQYQLLQAQRDADGARRRTGPVQVIPVADLMGLETRQMLDRPNSVAGTGAAREPLSKGLTGWLKRGAETRELVPVDETPGTGSGGGSDELARARHIYNRLERPVGLSFRPSPGLAAYSAKRGELRALGINLIGVDDSQLDHLAEEIGQAVSLNRRFAPVILTTTRSELGAFRRRRLTYESLPVFDEALARLTGIADRQDFYDLRVGYLLRKWQIKAVMNLGSAYVYRSGGEPARDQTRRG